MFRFEFTSPSNKKAPKVSNRYHSVDRLVNSKEEETKGYALSQLILFSELVKVMRKIEPFIRSN